MDCIITEKAVFDVHGNRRLMVVQLWEGSTVDKVKISTDCTFAPVPSPCSRWQLDPGAVPASCVRVAAHLQGFSREGEGSHLRAMQRFG